MTTYSPFSGTSNWYDLTASASVAATIDANTGNAERTFIYSTASGSTTGDLCYIHATVDKGL